MRLKGFKGIGIEMFEKIFASLLAMVIVGIVLTGCGPQKSVKVALPTKLEAGSLIGSSEVDCAKLYLKEKGVKNIEVVPFDDGWTPEKTEIAYKEARAQGINIFITSHTSTCALKLKELTDLEKDKVLVFITGSTTNKLSGLDDNNFRVVQDVQKEQTSIGKEIDSKGYKHLLIIRDLDNNKYTEPALEFFKSVYTGKMTLIDISIKDLNISKLKEQIKGIDYDGVYTLIGGNQTASGSIGQLAYTLNPQIKIYFTPWNNASTILETAGPSIKVSVMANHYPVKDEKLSAKAYFNMFKKAYNYSPTYNSLHVYRALTVLDEALKNNSVNPMDIKQFLLKQKKFETDFGTITFDEMGDVDMPLYFIENIPEAF